MAGAAVVDPKRHLAAILRCIAARAGLERARLDPNNPTEGQAARRLPHLAGLADRLIYAVLDLDQCTLDANSAT